MRRKINAFVILNTVVVTLVSTALSPQSARAGGRSYVTFSGYMGHAQVSRLYGRRIIVRGTSGGRLGAAHVFRRAPGLIIDGRCDSACALGFVMNPRACFTNRASFGFHGVARNGALSRTSTAWAVGKIRSSLRRRVAPAMYAGGVARISSRQMVRYYPDRRCSSRKKRVRYRRK
jgi:hypothetical protein